MWLILATYTTLGGMSIKRPGPDHQCGFLAKLRLPIGLEDVSGFPRLFAVLIQRGWSDDELRKLAGENLLRDMRTTEDVAYLLRGRSRPGAAPTGV